MIVHTRLMLDCPHCGEPKLISVTILDDVIGPVMCDDCLAPTIMTRRLARPETPASSRTSLSRVVEPLRIDRA